RPRLSAIRRVPDAAANSVDMTCAACQLRRAHDVKHRFAGLVRSAVGPGLASISADANRELTAGKHQLRIVGCNRNGADRPEAAKPIGKLMDAKPAAPP